MVYLETPVNPTLEILDIRGIADEIAKANRRRRKDARIRLVVDNTFATPYLQQPLALGADLVVHSTTKYLNGHSDVVGGAVVAGTAERAQELAWWANCLGLSGSPFDSFLTLRGLRTLHARLAVHERNARGLAEWLSREQGVARVYYPGLATHPGHAIARRQQGGYGAIISIELAGGEPAVRRFVDGLELFSLAESLGGVESLVAHPATMTHAAMEPEARARAGLVDGLLRLSVGIEDLADLQRDLAAGLQRAVAGA